MRELRQSMRMLHYIRAAVADVRRGRNLDVYLAVVAALVVGILGVLGEVHLRWISSVLLLCMVPLLNLVLAISDRVQLHSSVTPLQEYPPDELRASWGATDDLRLVGITLIRTVRDHQADITRRVVEGKVVEVLVADPEHLVTMELTELRRHFGEPNPESNAQEVKITLAFLSDLKRRAPSGRLEIKVIRYPIALSGCRFGAGKKARLYVETYPFRTPLETHPHYVLSSKDGHWHDHFMAELDNIWEMGVPYVPTTG